MWDQVQAQKSSGLCGLPGNLSAECMVYTRPQEKRKKEKVPNNYVHPASMKDLENL